MSPPRAYPIWVLGGILLAILLVSGGAVAYRLVTTLAGVERSAIAGEPSTLRRAAPEARGEALASAAVPLVDAPADAPAPAIGESIPLAEPVPEQPALVEPPPLAASESPVAPSKPPPTQAELQAALSATPIVMYSASWCGVCRKAKQFLTENGLRYQEIDADTTPGAWDKIERLIGRRGVPVIIVDGELTPAGLSPPGIMRAVSHSLERRLGVRGIRYSSG
ncbi:MAG: glutaredoxin domain-containing protein [Myxococcales bacterium]